MLRRLVIAAAMVVAAVSCSAPPEKERHQAEGALAAARAADAATYAPAELKTAEDALAQYDAAVAAGDYRQALNLALAARDGASEAAKRASDEKAAARGTAEQRVAELDALTRTATARLGGVGGPRPSGATAERMRTALRPAASALQEARARLGRQDYRGAIASVEPVLDLLRKAVDAANPPPSPAAAR
jgi:hypothetical protein